MKKAKCILFVFMVLASIAFWNGQASANGLNPSGPNSAQIKLKAKTSMVVRPLQTSETPASAPKTSGQQVYYLVQFTGPIEEAWKESVTAAGADILDYIPEFTFKVRMNPAGAQQVRQFPFVARVEDFYSAYKVCPMLTRGAERAYRIRLERGANGDEVQAAIEAIGARVLKRRGDTLTISADGTQIDAVTEISDIAWVQDFKRRKKHNEFAAGIIMGCEANGYDGSTQTVAVADTGIGGGTKSSVHPSISPERVTAIHDWPGSNIPDCVRVIQDGPGDIDSGHGTHATVSAVGGAFSEGRGAAPGARLVFQALEDYAVTIGTCRQDPDSYLLIGIPDDIRELFAQAYAPHGDLPGARIHSNSWGSDAAGAYESDSAQADDFVWNHPDMAITFSAGNSGTDSDANGEIDQGSVGSPATAKNVITVGASENDRSGGYGCDLKVSQAGINDIGTYGDTWPNDFSADPVASDPSSGNAEQMAAFSSRGPTNDGRIKPDLVAPGTWILSGYSGKYRQAYDPSPNPCNKAWQSFGWGYPANGEYKYMGGTSMSNPLVAGAAAVVRDFYHKTHNQHEASAALVKATLINSAVDMMDENNDGRNDNKVPIPNIHEGWGRVNVSKATSGSHRFVDERKGLITGGRTEHHYDVATGGSHFKVSLVWSDYPSNDAAAQNLVNDLDLELTSPSGVTYRGNTFSGGWSISGGEFDRVNNVENVYIRFAEPGQWSVKINGYNIPFGPQPFAVVIDF